MAIKEAVIVKQVLNFLIGCNKIATKHAISVDRKNKKKKKNKKKNKKKKKKKLGVLMF